MGLVEGPAQRNRPLLIQRGKPKLLNSANGFQLFPTVTLRPQGFPLGPAERVVSLGQRRKTDMPDRFAILPRELQPPANEVVVVPARADDYFRRPRLLARDP